jgi:hypothetical protein
VIFQALPMISLKPDSRPIPLAFGTLRMLPCWYRGRLVLASFSDFRRDFAREDRRLDGSELEIWPGTRKRTKINVAL